MKRKKPVSKIKSFSFKLKVLIVVFSFIQLIHATQSNSLTEFMKERNINCKHILIMGPGTPATLRKPEDISKLRIGTLNLSSFSLEENFDVTLKTEKQLKMIADAILSSNTDIIMLQEVMSAEALEKLEKEFLQNTFKSIKMRTHDSHKRALALLVKNDLPLKISFFSHIHENTFTRDFPILEFRNRDQNLNQSNLVATAPLFTFFGVHLPKLKLEDPIRAQQRRSEIERSVEIIEAYSQYYPSKTPIFVLGDFGVNILNPANLQSFKSSGLKDSAEINDLDEYDKKTHKSGKQVSAIFVNSELDNFVKNTEVHPYISEDGQKHFPWHFSDASELPSNHFLLTTDLSFSKLLERSKERIKNPLFNQLNVGDTTKGTISAFTHNGALVDINGIRAFIHVSDMSWGYVSQISEKLKIGEEINFKVLDIDSSKERIFLGIKQLEENPWLKLQNYFSRGQAVRVTIAGFTDFGIFAKINGTDLQGLLYTQNLRVSNRDLEQIQNLKVGDEREVYIFDLNTEKKYITLSFNKVVRSNSDLAKNVAHSTPRPKTEPKPPEVIKPKTPFEVGLMLNDFIEQTFFNENAIRLPLQSNAQERELATLIAEAKKNSDFWTALDSDSVRIMLNARNNERSAFSSETADNDFISNLDVNDGEKTALRSIEITSQAQGDLNQFNENDLTRIYKESLLKMATAPLTAFWKDWGTHKKLGSFRIHLQQKEFRVIFDLKNKKPRLLMITTPEDIFKLKQRVDVIESL
jgi:predicted RNA-binding protein with RPS1 domain